MAAALIWFRNDLRLEDNPALQAALRAGLTPIPLYIHAPEEEGDWTPGAASEVWRLRSLRALSEQLLARGSSLQLLRGPSLEALLAAQAASGATAIFWNRRYEPAIEARDTVIKHSLQQRGLIAQSHNSALLFEPWRVATNNGDPYRVFTPFWRSALTQWRLPTPAPAPSTLPTPFALTNAISIEHLGLETKPAWDEGFWECWTPGEMGAENALNRLISDALNTYPVQRDFPADTGTSRLSPHLHFGEISPWKIAHRLLCLPESEAKTAFIRQLGWREFAHHLLHHFPQTPTSNFNSRFDAFPWNEGASDFLHAWQQGQTGIPIVDAGMRELWHTGWMHNRVRMVTASFLTKNLGHHWRDGARWFWDTLVDANLANNTLGWQWVAGCGADAAPYFRVFNPVLQAEKFDPKGEYIARWLPELAKLPPDQRHAPWKGLRPSRYPAPIVDLSKSRQSALDALARTPR